MCVPKLRGVKVHDIINVYYYVVVYMYNDCIQSVDWTSGVDYCTDPICCR